MALTIKAKRGTREQLNTAAGSSGLIQGEPYLITDEDRLAVGLSTSTYKGYAKEDELSKVVGINAQTGTTYTLVLTDAGKLVRCSNANAITLTIPKNSSVAFATGTIIKVEQQGAGVVTVAPVDTDVTINSGAKKTWEQYSVIELIKLDTNLWNVIGGSE